MPNLPTLTVNHSGESCMTASNPETFDAAAALSRTQIEGLVKAINVTRAIGVMDVLQKKGVNSAAIQSLKSVASWISDAKLDQILSARVPSDDALTAREACGGVAEIVLHNRLNNPAREKDARQRKLLNERQEALFSSINHVARTRTAEFERVLVDVAGRLPQPRLALQSGEFICVSGAEYRLLATGPATTCDCIEQQRVQLLKEAEIRPCGRCPDCVEHRQSDCLAREQENFLRIQSFWRCAGCSADYNQLNRIQGALVTGLADILLPIVSGISGLLARRGGDRSRGMNQLSIHQNLANHVAANLFYGTCQCELDADRMRRGTRKGRSDRNCGLEHSLLGWDPELTGLTWYVYSSAANPGEDAKAAVNFVMPAVPSELRAFTFSEASAKPRGLPGGMVVRLVGPHLTANHKVEPTSYQVYNVLHCTQCGEVVTFDNHCKCTRDGSSKWPSATERPDPILDAEGARTDRHPMTGDAILAFRVIPDAEPEKCVHEPEESGASLADRKAPFLFPHAGKSCPCCGKKMGGRGASVELPVSELIALSRRTQSTAAPSGFDEEETPDVEEFEWHLGLRRKKRADRATLAESAPDSEDVGCDTGLSNHEPHGLQVNMHRLVPALILAIHDKWGSSNTALNRFCESLLSEWQTGANETCSQMTFRDFAMMCEELEKPDQKKIHDCLAPILRSEQPF